MISLEGQRIGRLIVLKEAPRRGRYARYWLCQCDCGNTKEIYQSDLRGHRIGSCGCLVGESARARFTTHGHSKNYSRTPEYQTWKGMRTRCHNPSHHKYSMYGGRGISVCERWNSFKNFLADMGTKPTPKHTIERIDSNLDYTPENCRWATIEEQNKNPTNRNITLITYKGETHTVSDWARKIGLDPETLRARLKLGWSEAAALETPLLRRK